MVRSERTVRRDDSGMSLHGGLLSQSSRVALEGFAARVLRPKDLSAVAPLMGAARRAQASVARCHAETSNGGRRHVEKADRHRCWRLPCQQASAAGRPDGSAGPITAAIEKPDGRSSPRNARRAEVVAASGRASPSSPAAVYSARSALSSSAMTRQAQTMGKISMARTTERIRTAGETRRCLAEGSRPPHSEACY